MTLTPAYGRDYQGRKQVLADWNANKDFIVADYFSPYCGKPINKEQFGRGQRVEIRYGKLRKVMTVIA